MSQCNFLLRLETEPEYHFLVLDECPGATQAQGALKYWFERHKDLEISPTAFKRMVKEQRLCVRVWAKFLYMAAVVEQAFLIKLVDVPGKRGQQTISAEPAEGNLTVNPSLR